MYCVFAVLSYVDCQNHFPKVYSRRAGRRVL